MEPGEAERRKRAAERAARVTIRKDGQSPAEGDPVHLTPEQSVALVYELTLTAWALSGKPFPQYTRATMPIRRVTSKDE
jgi:hypothetical protein